MHRRAGRTSDRATATACLVVALLAAACSPAPSPSESPAPVVTPSPAPTPTAAPVAGFDWGEPVRLPDSQLRAGPALAASFGGRIIAASSLRTAEGFSIAVWSSADGVEWVIDLPEALNQARASRLILGPEGLILVGFRVTTAIIDSSTPIRVAIWTSTDGRTWTDVATGPEFDLGSITDIASDGSRLLAIGREPVRSPEDEACPSPRVWRSTGGVTAWEAMPGPEPCARLMSVAGHEGRFVVVGQLDPDGVAGAAGAEMTAAWLVEGDAPWRRIEGIPETGTGYDVAAGPAGFVAVATTRRDLDPTASPVLFSADGESWAAVDAGVFDGEAAPLLTLNAVGSDDAFFVSSDRHSPEGLVGTMLWRSVDGRTWTKVPRSTALDRTWPLAGIVAHGSSVIGIGGRTSIVAWVSPPAPHGPAAPELLEPRVSEAVIPGGGAVRSVAFDGDSALAVGSESDFTTGTTEGRVWSWSPAAGWATVETTGLDEAELVGLVRGPDRWVAIGHVRRPPDSELGLAGVSIPYTWTSTDGRDWTGVSLEGVMEAGLARRLSQIVVGGPGYVLVGFGGSAGDSCPGGVGSLASVVLTSPDGLAWTVVDDPDLACGSITGIASSSGRLVAVGAWSRLVTVPAPFASPCGLEICLGATGYVESRPAAWVSTDGRSWTGATGLESFPGGGRGFTSVTAGPGGYVATWVTDSLYVSRDGLAWTAAPIPIGQSVQSVDLVRGTVDGYLAMGVTRRQDSMQYAFFASPDGAAWIEVDPKAWAVPTGTYVSTIDGADSSGFLVIGGQGGPGAGNVSWRVEP